MCVCLRAIASDYNCCMLGLCQRITRPRHWLASALVGRRYTEQIQSSSRPIEASLCASDRCPIGPIIKSQDLHNVLESNKKNAIEGLAIDPYH